MPKIMIVEDDPFIRQATQLQLRNAGYDTLWAEDPESALRVCKSEKPDLILLDLGLCGDDGFMVLQGLKQINASIPIIVLSARDPALNEDRALSCGAVLFMQKPVPVIDLLDAIAKCLRTL